MWISWSLILTIRDIRLWCFGYSRFLNVEGFPEGCLHGKLGDIFYCLDRCDNWDKLNRFKCPFSSTQNSHLLASISLLALLNELLHQIAQCAACSGGGDANLNSFTCTNRYLYSLLNVDLHGIVNSKYLLHRGIENDQINTISLVLAHGVELDISFKPFDDQNAVELAACHCRNSQR